MVPRLPILLLVVLCSFAALGGDAPVTRYDNDVFVMQAHPTITPGSNPLDLVGQTLRAEPVAGSESFKVTRGPIAPKTFTGNPLVMRNTDLKSYRQQELPFEFPLGDKRYKTIYITPFGSIYFAPPPLTPRDQYRPASVLAVGMPVVAPMMIGWNPQLWSETELRVRDFGRSFGVEWTFLGKDRAPDVRFGGQVQAVLHDDGRIEFSYPAMTRFHGGSVVISTGSEGERERRAMLATVSDATGDGGAADIRSMELNHLDALDLIEIRIDLTGPVPQPLTIDLHATANAFYLDWDVRTTAASPVSFAWWGGALPVVHVSGSTIRYLLHESLLPPAKPFTFIVTLVDDANVKLDTATIAGVNVPAATARPKVDLSAGGRVSMPLVEAFTIPGVDLRAVWNALAAQYNLPESYVDGIVIYTTFPTALDYWTRSNISNGNPGVDGLSTGHSTIEARRTPDWMHIGTAEQIRTLLHDTGHRWLFYPYINVGGKPTRLSPNNEFPWKLDATAALVKGGTSPMGGGALVDRGNNRYDIVCSAEKGYTWLELYLMGLADPSEVPPMLLIEEGRVDSFCGGTADATKTRMLTIQQVIEATGRRNPTYATSQKVFRYAYVLIDDPALNMIPDAEARMRSFAAQHAREFSAMTGGRGTIVAVTGPARRRRPAY